MKVNKREQGSKNFIARVPLCDPQGVIPSSEALNEYICSKYGNPGEMGPSPHLRYRLDYAAADDWYECLVDGLVNRETSWLDVGCGRDLFPSNAAGAETLSRRAAYLVGVDPDSNVHENALLSERFQGVIEDYTSERKFNLITLRMVAEHVVDADRCVSKLAELSSPGGLVVIYTPWKWAPMSLAASVVPFAFHNRLKRLLWDSEEQDTFPTAYNMNTRKDLCRLFNASDFEEALYVRVDDCSVFTRYLWLNALEIRIRNGLLKLGIPYPEFCLLSVYRKL